MKNSDMPAMPIVGDYGQKLENSAGLTKREHFAAMAMQGMLVSYKEFYESCPLGDRQIKRICSASVQAADALLAELEATK